MSDTLIILHSSNCSLNDSANPVLVKTENRNTKDNAYKFLEEYFILINP